MSIFRIFSLVICISTCVSCVATTKIGIKRDFKKADFRVGVSTKSDVVNYLGLPRKIVKQSDGTEKFIYDGEATLTNMQGSQGSSSPGLIPALMNKSDVDRGAIYIFSSKGRLLKKVESKQKPIIKEAQGTE